MLEEEMTPFYFHQPIGNQGNAFHKMIIPNASVTIGNDSFYHLYSRTSITKGIPSHTSLGNNILTVKLQQLKKR